MSREKLMASFVVKSIRLSTTLLLSLSRDFVTACCIFCNCKRLSVASHHQPKKRELTIKSKMSDDSSTSSAEQSVKEEKEEEITDLSNR